MAHSSAAHARVHDEIVRLAHRGLPTAEFARAVGDALARAVPAEGTCLMTTDPATMLPTAEFVENGLPAAELLRLVEIEVREPDFNTWARLARAARPAGSLSDATAGDLDRSLRQREIRRPGGFSDELRVVLADGTGTWGQLTVFREAGRPYFSPAEVEFAASIADVITDGLRRGLLLGDARAGDDDVGLLVLDAGDGVRMSNRAAEHLLDELGTGGREGARLPLVISSVARQARSLFAPAPGAAPAPPAPGRPGPGPAPGRPVADRPGLAAGRRPGTAGRGDAGSRSSRRDGALDGRCLRLHRQRAPGHRAGGQGPVHQADRQPPARVVVHRPGPPEVDLRQVGQRLARRPDRPAVPRPPRRLPDVGSRRGRGVKAAVSRR
ncbi:hypothetical protein [Actinomadura madurae]|uniref:hypothetical protein n=1 Tax=Actinomadura madurae TaxID=1993 RepID=UPI003FD871C5